MGEVDRKLGRYRRWYAEDPEGAAASYAAALNSAAIDEIGRHMVPPWLDEAEGALLRVIDDFGATPGLVHALVITYINDAQANAFCGKYGWVDLGRALGAAEEAVRWQRELVARAVDPVAKAPAEAVARERSVLVNALLTLARVQANCALDDEALATFLEARELVMGDGPEGEWWDVMRSVGHEVGADPAEFGGSLAPDDRTEFWLCVMG